jgi:hypothetical protein
VELHLKINFVLHFLSALSHEREALLCEENVELDKKMNLKRSICRKRK